VKEKKNQTTACRTRAVNRNDDLADSYVLCYQLLGSEGNTLLHTGLKPECGENQLSKESRRPHASSKLLVLQENHATASPWLHLHDRFHLGDSESSEEEGGVNLTAAKPFLLRSFFLFYLLFLSP
jgi:hypothetical protein